MEDRLENENSPIEGRRLPEASEMHSVEARKSSGEVQARIPDLGKGTD